MVDLALQEETIYWLSLTLLISALLIIAASVYFGRILHRGLIEKFYISENIKGPLNPSDDFFREIFERNNEFWTTYGQIALAVFIVAVLAVLLLTKTISSEAGLPIFSAISGFAIAKGASVSRSSASPQSGQGANPEHPGGKDKGKDDGGSENSEQTQPSSKVQEPAKDVGGVSNEPNGDIAGIIYDEKNDVYLIDGAVLTRRQRRRLPSLAKIASDEDIAEKNEKK